MAQPDISDLPAPSPDISDLPAPGAAPPASNDPTAYARRLASITDPAEAGAAARAYTGTDGPRMSLRDAGQAAGSGLASGAVDLAGLPADTVVNLSNLVNAGVGFATGTDTTSRIVDPVDIPGTSAWAKDILRKHGLGHLVDNTNPQGDFLHGAVEAVPAAIATSGESTAPGIARAALGGAAAGGAQQAAASAGAGAVGQTAAGILGGALAHGAGPVRAVEPSLGAAETAATIEGTTPPKAPKVDLSKVQYDREGVAIAPKAAEAPAAAVGSIGRPFAEEPPAPPAGTTPTPISDTDQAQRAATLKAVGLGEARESAITGDAKEGAGDFQTSKLDNAAGKRMSGVIDNERAALQNYADKLTADTGGTAGTDQNVLLGRGAAILNPLDRIQAGFDDQIKKLYAQADARAQGTPLELPSVQRLVSDSSNFLGTTEGEALLKGVQARMKSLGMTDDSGAARPVTVQQAEQFKQYLNNQWQPRTARLIAQLKDATDNDVTQGAGVDIYRQARALRAARAQVLDNPDGISKLMDSSGPQGINRAVAVEQVPDALARMPVAQFAHTVNVLKAAAGDPSPINLGEVAVGLQPQAREALNEIRAHFASRVAEAGNKTQSMWNNKGVTQYLNQNAARLAHVFTPQEMSRFKTLNDAGNILKLDRSYPGAAAQAHNFVQRGVLKAAEHAPELGALVGHIPGAILGAGVKAGASRIVDKAGLAAIEKRIRRL